MARCGCVGTCMCAVVAGTPNVTVMGNGNPSSPYVISVLSAAEDCVAVMQCVAEAVTNGTGLTYDPDTNELSTLTPGGAAPRARILRSTSFDVPPGPGAVPVPLDAAQSNVGGMWSPAFPTRLTIPAGAGGFYTVGGGFLMQNQGGTSGFRAGFIRLNGSILIAGDQKPVPAPNTTVVNVTTGYSFSEGDFVELMADHGQDDPCTLVANEFSPVLWATLEHLN